MQKTLATIEKYILLFFALLFPIIVLPISPNPFVVSRVSVLVYTLVVLIVLRAIRVLISGKFNVNKSVMDVPVLLFGAVYFLAAMLATTNKMEAALLPGTATVVVGSTLLFLLINQLSAKDKKAFKQMFFFSGALYALVELVAFSRLFEQLTFLPRYMQTENFTPEGGYLPTALFLAILLPIGFGLMFGDKGDAVKKILSGVASVLIVLGLTIAIVNILPGSPRSPKLPSYPTSWSIAIDTIQQNPLFGAGPGNYLTAFNLFRPIRYNASDLWAIKFSTARSYYFTAITETGLAGTVALGVLITATIRMIKKTKRDAYSAPLIGALTLLLILLLLFPSTPLIIMSLFILLGLLADQDPMSLRLFTKSDSGAKSNLPAVLLSLPVIAAMAAVGFYATKFILAERAFKLGVDAVAANNGREAYEHLQTAININPRVDRYHSAYAQVNLAIANSLAGNENLSEQDKQTITQLVQQSIREGKAAVALNQTRAENWNLLGSIYRSLVTVAEGADQFAVQSFSQGVALDPLNVNTRIALGGIFYAAGQYEDAIDIFTLAVRVKPDFANAYYNLAFAYKEAGQTERAVAALTQVLALVDKDSEDYTLAKAELEKLENEIPDAQEPGSGDELTAPGDSDTDITEPEIELGEDDAPPEDTGVSSPNNDEIENSEEGSDSASPSPSPSSSPTPRP